MKLSSFRYLVGQGFDNVWKNRVMAFASFCVLLVSLLLVKVSGQILHVVLTRKSLLEFVLKSHRLEFRTLFGNLG